MIIVLDNCGLELYLLRPHTYSTLHQVIIVLDNCGLELVSDLLLVDGMLRCAAPPLRVRVRVRG